MRIFANVVFLILNAIFLLEILRVLSSEDDGPFKDGR